MPTTPWSSRVIRGVSREKSARHGLSLGHCDRVSEGCDEGVGGSGVVEGEAEGFDLVLHLAVIGTAVRTGAEVLQLIAVVDESAELLTRHAHDNHHDGVAFVAGFVGAGRFR